MPSWGGCGVGQKVTCSQLCQQALQTWGSTSAELQISPDIFHQRILPILQHHSLPEENFLTLSSAVPTTMCQTLS